MILRFNSLIVENIKGFLRLFGVNKAVFFGIVTKIWAALTGIITILLIAKYFTPEIQGYYFTFYSLLGFQMFIELGLGAVIVSFASHEWSKLGFDERGNIVGDQNALSRLQSLARVVFKWFVFGGVILFVFLGFSGYFFFSYSNNIEINWMLPWFMLCLFSGINLSFSPLFSLLEGCGQVSNIYYLRLISSIVRFFSVAIVIVVGGELWATVSAILFPMIWAFVYILKRYYKYVRALFKKPLFSVIDWRRDVWPMQWRIAVSWLSGYFFFWLFVPVLFHFHGPVVAGQMGITWKIVSSLSMMASLWVLTRAPQFGMLVSEKKYRELDKLYFRSAVMAVVIAFVGAMAVLGGLMLITYWKSSFVSRLLDPLPVICFLTATILMQISYAQTIYLRAHKKEPFMLLFVVSSVIMALLVIFTGSRWGALGVALSYLFVVSIIMVPIGTIIWLRFKKEWYPKDLSVKVDGFFNDDEPNQK